MNLEKILDIGKRIVSLTLVASVLTFSPACSNQTPKKTETKSYVEQKIPAQQEPVTEREIEKVEDEGRLKTGKAIPDIIAHQYPKYTQSYAFIATAKGADITRDEAILIDVKNFPEAKSIGFNSYKTKYYVTASLAGKPVNIDFTGELASTYYMDRDSTANTGDEVYRLGQRVGLENGSQIPLALFGSIRINNPGTQTKQQPTKPSLTLEIPLTLTKTLLPDGGIQLDKTLIREQFNPYTAEFAATPVLEAKNLNYNINYSSQYKYLRRNQSVTVPAGRFDNGIAIEEKVKAEAYRQKGNIAWEKVAKENKLDSYKQRIESINNLKRYYEENRDSFN